jgi:hypothetical protein
MFNNLGFHWAGSLLGFIGLVLSFVPLLLLWKGRQIRARSPFMAESTWDDEGKQQRQGVEHSQDGSDKESMTRKE